MTTKQRLLSRFWPKIKFMYSGCWEWVAAKDHRGYGRLTFDGETSILAHRISWELFNGVILRETPNVLHKCDNPSCINPNHLFLGTQRDNIYDAAQKGRLIYGLGNLKKTACSRGHQFDLVIERTDGRTYRACRQCKNYVRRAWRAHRRAAGLPRV